LISIKEKQAAEIYSNYLQHQDFMANNQDKVPVRSMRRVSRIFGREMFENQFLRGYTVNNLIEPSIISIIGAGQTFFRQQNNQQLTVPFMNWLNLSDTRSYTRTIRGIPSNVMMRNKALMLLNKSTFAEPHHLSALDRLGMLQTMRCYIQSIQTNLDPNVPWDPSCTIFQAGAVPPQPLPQQQRQQAPQRPQQRQQVPPQEAPLQQPPIQPIQLSPQQQEQQVNLLDLAQNQQFSPNSPILFSPLQSSPSEQVGSSREEETGEPRSKRQRTEEPLEEMSTPYRIANEMSTP